MNQSDLIDALTNLKDADRRKHDEIIIDVEILVGQMERWLRPVADGIRGSRLERGESAPPVDFLVDVKAPTLTMSIPAGKAAVIIFAVEAMDITSRGSMMLTARYPNKTTEQMRIVRIGPQDWRIDANGNGMLTRQQMLTPFNQSDFYDAIATLCSHR